MYAYVGSRTTRERHARGEGITVFRVEPASGALSRVQVVGDLVNPSYLAMSANGRSLYTVHGDQSEVSAFSVDRSTGQLSFLNRQSTQGRNPVHLALDASGQHLLVTNHIGASVVVLPIGKDGELGPVAQLVPFQGPTGPHRVEQQQAKPHFSAFDTAYKFVVVPDKGLDRVFSFEFTSGRLVPAMAPSVATREAAGPRHLAFHPDRPRAYVVNELDSTVTTYNLDESTGEMTPLQVLPCLPSTFTGNSRAAGIAIDAGGRHVYASNRGHDSVAVFSVDATTGLLSWRGCESTGGKTPRFFTLSPSGKLLYALNEDSDTISTLVVGEADGLLKLTDQRVACGSPVCMVFSPGEP